MGMAVSLARRSLLVLLTGAGSAQAAFWERKRFAEWSEEEVRRLLTDSPWAQVLNIPLKLEKPEPGGPATWKDVPGAGPSLPDASPGGMGGSPVGGIGAPRPKLPTSAQIIVRWRSALPVRQALVRHKFGAEIDSVPARRLLELEEPFYVIEVLGIPSLVAHRGPEYLQTELFRTAFLRTRAGRLLRAESVYVAVQGLFLGITLRFPRKDPLRREDGWVEVGGRAEAFEFLRRFDLRRMTYAGRPAL